MASSEKSWPMEIVGQTPFYRCVCCRKLFPLRDAIEITRGKGFSRVAAVRTGSSQPRDFKSTGQTFGSRDGLWTVKEPFRPLVTNGPICPDCR